MTKLSRFWKPNAEQTALLATYSKKLNKNIAYLLNKFKAKMKGRISTDWNKELLDFLIREKPQYRFGKGGRCYDEIESYENSSSEAGRTSSAIDTRDNTGGRGMLKASSHIFRTT